MGREARARAAGLVADPPAETPFDRITNAARRYNEAARDGQPLAMLVLLHRDLARAVRAAPRPVDLRSVTAASAMMALYAPQRS